MEDYANQKPATSSEPLYDPRSKITKSRNVRAKNDNSSANMRLGYCC